MGRRPSSPPWARSGAITLSLLLAACGTSSSAPPGHVSSVDSGAADGSRADVTCPKGGQSAAEVETSGGAFAGTLQTPEGCGPYPLVLVYPGSGPTDRNGNDTGAGLKTNAYEDLAAALAAKGIASVRYDKRSISGGLRIDIRVFLRWVGPVEAFCHRASAHGLERTLRSKGA